MIKIFVIVFSVIFFIFTSEKVEAASSIIYVSPVKGRYLVNEDFKSTIWLKPNGNKISRAEIVLQFSGDYISVLKLEYYDYFEPSAENNFDNEKGIIKIAGEMKGDLQIDKPIAKIYFKPKIKGGSNVSIKRISKVYVDNFEIESILANANYTILPESKKMSELDIQFRNLEENKFGLSGLKLVPMLTSSTLLVGSPPVLIGKSPKTNSRIFFNVDDGLIRDMVVSDPEGNWNWELPSNLLPGKYSVKMFVYDPSIRNFFSRDEQMVEIIKNDVARYFYKLIATVPKGIRPGEELFVPISFSGMENLIQEGYEGYEIQYLITDHNENIIADQTETVNSTQIKNGIQKKFLIPEDAAWGKYMIYIKFLINDQEEAADLHYFSVSNYYPVIFTALSIIIISLTSIVWFVKKRKYEI